MRNCLLLSLTLLLCICTNAQKKNASYQLNIREALSSIKIDGDEHDAAWTVADSADNFFMVLPMDTSYAHVRTVVKMAYDATHMFVIAICYKNLQGPYMVESLRRDFTFGKNDNFIFFLDPFDDRTNGFTFGANAAGAQWDGTLYDGGKADLNWDNKWNSTVKNYSDRWVFEASIPFKSMRYKKDIKEWGVNFSRLDIRVAEKSAWAPVPRQFPTASLAYTGRLLWDKSPPTPSLNVSLIPYLLGGLTNDYEHGKPSTHRVDFGGDAKIALTSSLNLDLTANPDFSQVEVDKQVTNLDRYELFFPEKRQFFLENADLFANFGFANIRPFFSRRIGLGVPIRYGARLSGSIDKNWRIGAMDMQTSDKSDIGLPAQNFSVLALQRRVFARSNIRFMFVDKESLHYTPGRDTAHPSYSRYNRNAGLEYNLASANNKWTGKALVTKSFTPGKPGDDIAHAANIQYLSKHWTISWQHEYIGANHNAEVGYVPRVNYIKVNPIVSRLFFPAHGIVLSHGPRFSSTYFFTPKWRQTDNESFLMYTVNFRDQAVLDGWIAHDYVELLQPFDPTNSNKPLLATGTKHLWNAWGTDFISKPQKRFTYSVSTRAGGYYDGGKRLYLFADAGYRFQPFVSLYMSASYNHLVLPKPWNTTDFWLIGPRFDVTFTNKIFFTTFVQYNNQLKNINLNTRFQWRYNPASDFFIVYTDNYFPSPLMIRNRALVLKLTYWWNH